METPPSQKTCRNCEMPMQAEDKYCSNCSQKYTTGRVTLFNIVSDFFSQYFILDSKLFRPVIALFIPGKLTIEYFKGRHKKYSSPLQLFILTGVLLFAYVSFQVSKTEINDADLTSVKEDIDWLDFIAALDSAKFKTDSIYPQSNAKAATDSLLTFVIEDNRSIEDSIDFDFITDGLELPKISKRDLLNKSSNEIVEEYNEGWPFWKVLALKQGLKFFDGARGIIDYFISKLSLTIFFMMPFLALGLRILYFRRDYYYVEHLIFAFHYHAFAFLVILLISVIGYYIPGLILTFLIVSIFIFLYLAMLRVYKQGKFKTFIKFMTLMILYIFLVALFSVLSLLLSFVLF